MGRKLTDIEINARKYMYDEAINALFCYESDEENEIKQAENEQRKIVIRQINALADKFTDLHLKK